MTGAPRTGDQHRFSLAAYDDALDLNDLGYLERNDFTYLFYEYWWRRQDYEHIRETSDWMSLQADFNNDGQLTTGVLIAHQSWGFNDHTGVDLHFSYDAAHWDDRASRGHGIFKLPPSWWVDARWHSPRDRKMDASVGMGWRREAMGGRNAWSRLSVAWRPVGRIRASTEVVYENWDSWLLWQGDRRFATFATERWNLNAQLTTFFTARQHLELRVQWVALKAFESSRYVVPGGTYLREIERSAGEAPARFAISDLVMQLRYRWEIAPMSDLFIVYNRNGGLPNSGRRGHFIDLLDASFQTPDQTGLLVKLRYRFGL